MNLQASAGRAGRSLLPFEIIEITDKELETPRFANECTETYLNAVRKFIYDRVGVATGLCVYGPVHEW